MEDHLQAGRFVNLAIWLFQRRRRGAVADHLILIAGVLVMLLPVLSIAVSATHSAPTLIAHGLQFLPGDQGAGAYVKLASRDPLFADSPSVAGMLWVSLVIALGFAIFGTVISALAAYALVFFRWRGRGLVLGAILLSLWFPIETRFLPTFLVTAQLGLLNSYAGAILPLGATALGVFILRQSFLQTPPALKDAARLDGAGPIRFLADILIPVSAPMLAAVFLILFIVGWNQYLWPILIATEGDGLFTILRGLRRTGGLSGNLAMALAIAAIVPPALVMILFQRFMIKGLSQVAH